MKINHNQFVSNIKNDLQSFFKQEEEKTSKMMELLSEKMDSFTASLELQELLLQANNEDEGDTDFLKCLEIARRIQGGHKVPERDRKFLAEKQPEMYLRAMLMKNQNPKDPKKYQSLLDDEDQIKEQVAEINDSLPMEVQLSPEMAETGSEE